MNKFADYKTYITEEKLEPKLALPRKWIGEDILHLIPSIIIGPEGPVTQSVFFVTNQFLGEIAIDDKNNDQLFDFIKHTAFNYRMRMWSHEIKDGETTIGSYELAQLVVKHGESMVSELNFAGNKEDRNEWLDFVTSIFLPKLLRSA